MKNKKIAGIALLLLSIAVAAGNFTRWSERPLRTVDYVLMASAVVIFAVSISTLIGASKKEQK